MGALRPACSVLVPEPAASPPLPIGWMLRQDGRMLGGRYARTLQHRVQRLLECYAAFHSRMYLPMARSEPGGLLSQGRYGRQSLRFAEPRGVSVPYQVSIKIECFPLLPWIVDRRYSKGAKSTGLAQHTIRNIFTESLDHVSDAGRIHLILPAPPFIAAHFFEDV